MNKPYDTRLGKSTWLGSEHVSNVCAFISMSKSEISPEAPNVYTVLCSFGRLKE